MRPTCVLIAVLCITQGCGDDNSRLRVIPPPDPRGWLYLEIVSFEELVRDHIEHFSESQAITEDDIRALMERQGKSVQERHDGEVYAYGYRDKTEDGLRRYVLAPVNGGRIVPAKSGLTDVITFYDSQDRPLSYAYGKGNSGSGFRSQIYGDGSYDYLDGRGSRPFFYIYSMERNRPKFVFRGGYRRPREDWKQTFY